MINQKTFQKYAKSPATFRYNLQVDVDGNVKKFGDVMDQWQRKDFASLDAAMRLCNGQSDKVAVMRGYLERSRGHSKTTDLAVICVWLLVFSTRLLRGYAFAADKDQAKLLKDAMQTIIRLNPWLSDILEVQRDQVINVAKGHPGEGSKLEVFTSDVASSFGILPDFIIADELCHWQGDGGLWHSIISSAAKRSNCLLCVISNAGFIDSWQWKIREIARTEESWIFSRLDGPVASWLTEDRLAEQRKMLPQIAYSRLWENLWSSGGGDALTTEDIDAAFKDNLKPMNGTESDYLFVGGVDLGLKRDCAAVVVLAVPVGGKAGRIRLAHNKLWKPTPGHKVNLLDVEKHLLEIDEQFGLEFLAFDSWQAEHLMQTLEADQSRHRKRNQRHFHGQPWARDFPATGPNLRAQASHVIESFGDHRILLYDCEPLRRDLHKLRVEEKSYGFRLTSPRDGEGHGDTFSAFAIALLIAHEVAGDAPTKLTPMFGIGSKGTYNDEFAARVSEYEAEYKMLEEMEDDPFGEAISSGNYECFGDCDPYRAYHN